MKIGGEGGVEISVQQLVFKMFPMVKSDQWNVIVKLLKFRKPALQKKGAGVCFYF